LMRLLMIPPRWLAGSIPPPPIPAMRRGGAYSAGPRRGTDVGPAPASAWARLRRKAPGVAVATQRCRIYAEAMGLGVTLDAVIALVISIVATAALVSLGVV
jgi:hypothetical protein